MANRVKDDGAWGEFLGVGFVITVVTILATSGFAMSAAKGDVNGDGGFTISDLPDAIVSGFVSPGRSIMDGMTRSAQAFLEYDGVNMLWPALISAAVWMALICGSAWIINEFREQVVDRFKR